MDPKEVDSAEFKRAVARSDEIVTAIKQRGGDLTPAFEALEDSLRSFEDSGYSLETIVPATSEGTLGFSSIRDIDGRRFWEKYSRLVKKDLCAPDGELHHLVRSGLAGATGAVVTAVMTALSLPVAALPVVVPTAAILVTKGVEAFCLEGGTGSDEPRLSNTPSR